jgi:hypothetical protein
LLLESGARRASQLSQVEARHVARRGGRVTLVMGSARNTLGLAEYYKLLPVRRFSFAAQIMPVRENVYGSLVCVLGTEEFKSDRQARLSELQPLPQQLCSPDLGRSKKVKFAN